MLCVFKFGATTLKNSNGNAEAVNVGVNCPRIGGAFSRIASGKWVHTLYSTLDTLINKACVIKNIKNHISPRCYANWGKQDAFDHSACVQCAEPGCYEVSSVMQQCQIVFTLEKLLAVLG